MLKLLFLLLSLSILNVSAQVEVPGDRVECEHDLSVLPESTRLAIEEIRAALPLTVGAEDREIEDGGVIDSSCRSGDLGPRGDEIVEKIRRANEVVMQRLSECGPLMRLWEPQQAMEVLARTRITCSVATNTSEAGRMDWSASCDRMLATAYSPRLVGRFHMNLPVFVGTVKDGKDPSFLAASDDENASFLFHEAMHVLAANNRSWHNSLDGRGTRGCENSQFEDRIYMLQAGCFPQSNYGLRVRDPELGIRSCPEVCTRALTEVDADAMPAALIPNSDPTAPGFFGPSEVAIPYSRESAERACRLILAE
jgi:hypothetical protein